MGMFGQIRNSVNSILPKLYSDEELTVDVTWKKFSSDNWDSGLGVNVASYVSYTVTAIKLEKELKPAVSGGRASGVSMAVSDVLYLFQYDDLPDDISNRDVIVENGNEYQVDKIHPVFGLVIKVEVKGYA